MEITITRFDKYTLKATTPQGITIGLYATDCAVTATKWAREDLVKLGV